MDFKSSKPGPYHTQNPEIDFKKCLGLATWADEDFIGKIARVSRKAHNLKPPFSTIKQSWILYKEEWCKTLWHKWASGRLIGWSSYWWESVCAASVYVGSQNVEGWNAQFCGKRAQIWSTWRATGPSPSLRGPLAAQMGRQRWRTWPLPPSRLTDEPPRPRFSTQYIY